MIDTEVWVLPRPSKSKYPGSFPLHFERKLYRLLGCPQDVIHPFGGMAEIGKRVDINPDVYPDYIGDAHNLHFIDDGSFDLVILDPPYTNKNSREMYKGGNIRFWTYMNEAVRICRKGGHIALYHWMVTPRPKGTEFVHRIVIVLRPWHTLRICQIYEKI